MPILANLNPAASRFPVFTRPGLRGVTRWDFFLEWPYGQGTVNRGL